MADQPSSGSDVHSGLQLWPHTGIQAPTTFEIRDVAEMDDPPSLEFSGQLHHPDLGHIGTIANRGIMGGTRFIQRDGSDFDRDHLRAYSSRCRQYGRPLAFGASTLLDAIRAEYLTAAATALMRQSSGMLVRQFAPAAADEEEPFHGDLVHLPYIALSPTERHHALKSAHPHPLAPLQPHEWQMFTGREWHPLDLSTQTDESAPVARRAASTTDGTTDPSMPVPLVVVDGWHVTGPVAGPAGEHWVRIATDPYPVAVRAWCRCLPGARSRRTRFQIWDCSGEFVASGEVHAARRCRRLVVLD